jgi:dephospho-CoA kinase
VARDVVAPGSAGLAAVVARFGPGVLKADGQLDRPALARLVFADAAARRDLERLVHPAVRTAIERFFAGLPPGAVGVAEVPLLYETGWVATFDLALVAACRRETQRARLAARDSLTAADVDARLGAQWPIDDKARLADAVVITEGPMASTVAQAERLADWLRGRSSLS